MDDETFIQNMQKHIKESSGVSIILALDHAERQEIDSQSYSLPDAFRMSSICFRIASSSWLMSMGSPKGCGKVS